MAIPLKRNGWFVISFMYMPARYEGICYSPLSPLLFSNSLEMLDKSEVPVISEGYTLVVAMTALIDAVKSVSLVVTDEVKAKKHVAQFLHRSPSPGIHCFISRRRHLFYSVSFLALSPGSPSRTIYHLYTTSVVPSVLKY